MPVGGEHFETVVPVEAYSGYRENERPLAFWAGGKRVPVRRILERRRSPDFDEFRVEAGDGGVYRIAWDRRRDLWLLR